MNQPYRARPEGPARAPRASWWRRNIVFWWRGLGQRLEQRQFRRVFGTPGDPPRAVARYLMVSVADGSIRRVSDIVPGFSIVEQAEAYVMLDRLATDGFLEEVAAPNPHWRLSEWAPTSMGRRAYSWLVSQTVAWSEEEAYGLW